MRAALRPAVRKDFAVPTQVGLRTALQTSLSVSDAINCVGSWAISEETPGFASPASRRVCLLRPLVIRPKARPADPWKLLKALRGIVRSRSDPDASRAVDPRAGPHHGTSL